MAKTETERFVLYGGAIEIDYYPNSHRYKLVKQDGVEKNEWVKSPSGIVDKLDKSAALMSWAVRCFLEKVVEEMRDGVNFSKDDVMSMLTMGKAAYVEKKQQAADVGSIVHEYAQKHHEIKSVEVVEGFESLTDADKAKVLKGAQAFDSWYSQLGGVSVKNEFLVYSRKQKFAGRCDDLIKIGDKYYIVDYKTSKGIYTSQIYQVTSYMKAEEEENPDIKISGAILLHLVKEDVVDKEGNIIKKAGEFGVVTLSRSDLVKAYTVFKALKVVADTDPVIQKLLN